MEGEVLKMVKVVCPACSEELNIPIEQVGMRGQCKKCAATITAKRFSEEKNRYFDFFAIGILATVLIVFVFAYLSPPRPNKSDSIATGARSIEGSIYSNAETAQIEYEVFDTDVDDTPLKAMVKRRLIVTGGTVSKETLSELMEREYQSIRSMQNLRYHRYPTQIVVTVFQSEAHTEWGQWIALRRHHISNGDKSIDFNERQLQDYYTPPMIKHGLTEEERKAIFIDACNAEFDARKTAEKVHPLPKPVPGFEHGDKNFNASWVGALRAQTDLKDQLTPENEEQVIQRHGITREVLDAITLEAFERDWPLPSN